MTSDEIIKSLQEATLYRKVCQDDEEIATAIVKQKFLKDVLVLVCRQKAKIEALTMDNNQLQSDIENANCNCDRLETEKDNLIKTYAECQTENINKFGEKFLKIVYDNHYPLISHGNSVGYGMFTIGIEQAVNEAKKEMVGENNG